MPKKKETALSSPKLYRCVFVSDLHMGSPKFSTFHFLSFLQSFECEHLYLGGDIIDGWKLKKDWYWPKEYNLLLAEILRKHEQGTKITYITGNHDARLRRLSLRRVEKFHKAYGIRIKTIDYHETLKKERFLILHGDQFDWAILRGPVSEWSDRFYHFLSERFLYRLSPRIAVKGKKKRFSLAKALRKSGTRALYLLNNFERAALRRITSDGVDGLICGHTHIPTIKNLKDKIYANSGSWVAQTSTALVENTDGTLEILSINTPSTPSTQSTNFENERDFEPPELYAYLPHAEKLFKHIQRIWKH
ncbi:MAG: UDP-2,3-diacylglucosamine diphosphatase [Bdellovibrionales bacterium]